MTNRKNDISLSNDKEFENTKENEPSIDFFVGIYLSCVRVCRCDSRSKVGNELELVTAKSHTGLSTRKDAHS